MKTTAILLLLALLAAPPVRAADANPPEWIYRPKGNFEGQTARPLRYHPDGTDFVITNGTEFFNRPLYCLNTAFRVDSGDKPEFSIYLPGRGGNLRFGIKTADGLKWLNDAEKIVARYRPGSMVYEIHDPLLGDGELDLAVLPLSETKGFILQVELRGTKSSVELVWAFGGANGMKGSRNGDIGCEKEPVSQFFQLRPEQCKGNEFSVESNTFVLHSKPATIAGVAPIGAKLALADANQWAYLTGLLNSANDNFSLAPGFSPVIHGNDGAKAVSTVSRSGGKTVETVSNLPASDTGLKPGANEKETNTRPFEFPLVVGQTTVQSAQPVYFALQQVGPDMLILCADDLPKTFAAAESRRRTIAEQVVVDTPDPFINAAASALCVAGDAIWDQQQQSFMHGAVAWRVRLLGWRGPYTGDALGWHERTAAHFAGYAKQQNTDPVPEKIPSADADSNLARNETALHSNGDLTKSHYDMNLVGVDAFFRHLLWTGDLDYARRMWPVIERHLAWEHRLFRREFGPDQLPLYEAYAAIWASDNMNYNGGGATHASAYNYWHNKMAARVAKLIGKDPAPYEQEAELIQKAMQKYLWLADEGNFAESKDYLGLQLAHPNAGLWTFYHTMDSEVPTPAEAWQMSRWVDTNIAHIPVEFYANDINETKALATAITSPPRPAKNERGEGRGEGQPTNRTSSPRPSPPFHGGEGEDSAFASLETNLYTLPTTSWMPYLWSLNNVVMAEVAHTSLAYWQANRPDAAFSLFKGCLLDSMYLGLCPGNLGMTTGFDLARGEAQRDFGDSIGITARALVEGLFGVRPDALAGELKICPGFPAQWDHAGIRHPDFNFSFRRDGLKETFTIEPKFSKPMVLRLQIPALRDDVAGVTVNGRPAKWSRVEGAVGLSRVEIQGEAADKYEIVIAWRGGAPVSDPARFVTVGQHAGAETGAPVAMDWKKKLPAGVKLEAVDLASVFNDRVTQIFRNEYLSPRSPFCSLAMPKQSFGGWCDYQLVPGVDDSGLRAAAAKSGGKFVLPNGVSFQTPIPQSGTDAKNIVFTSQWDNYPRAVFVPLTGKSSHVYLLMAGSTGPMQSRFDNGEVIVTYTDGMTERLALRNPANWWPIDQDYFIDDYAFRRPGPIPPRVDLKTGEVRIPDVNEFKGKGGKVPGGAATVLDLPLKPDKELKSLTVRTLANEVVIGLMAVTLERGT